MFAIYIWICAQVIYAKQKGYIPVVDLRHNKNSLFKDNREYRDNAWEYMFEQPENIGLDDLEADAKIIIAGNTVPKVDYLWAGSLPITKEDRKNPPIADEYIKYLKIRPEIKDYLEEKYQKVTGGNENILGILCRGTDYTNIKPLNHAIQPKVEEVIAKTDELMRQKHYDKIWLATEDAGIYEKFKEKFEDKLLENDQYKFSDTRDQYLYQVETQRKDHMFNLSKEYFASMYILAKCKAFIGGRTSGTVAVYLLSNKFKNMEYFYLWDKGFYKNRLSITLEDILKSIFSIENGDTHKIFRLLGFKFKFKK